MMHIIRIIRTVFRWLYWFPFRTLVQHLPYQAGFILIFPAALLGYIFLRKKRKITRDGLLRMFDDKLGITQQKWLVFKTFYSHFKKGIDVFWYPKLTEKMSEKIISCEGLEWLNAALLKGKGVILLHGHLGNAHMIMPGIGFKGYTLNQLGSRNPPEIMSGFLSAQINRIERKIFDLKLAYKEALPVKYVYTDKFLRHAIRCLEKNEIIAMALDGREGIKWAEIEFLKQRALFSTGVMKLIYRTKPVVLPTFVVRQDDNTHAIIITRPMKLTYSGNEENDIIENIKIFLSLFEQYIYAYPYLYGDSFWLGNTFFLENEKE